MLKKSVMTFTAIIILMFQCFVVFGVNDFSCSPVETRADEQFSANFPDAKTDDFNEYDGYDYIKVTNGLRSVIRFEVQNDLASGQEFHLKLENITPWNIAFTTSSDTMPLWVDGKATETSDIWITTTVVGEKIIYLNITLGSKYTVQALMLVSLPPSITLSADQTSLVVDPGGRADFNVSIENNLAEADNVELTLSNNIVEGNNADDNSWIGSLSDDSLTIPGNSVKHIVLTVFSPNLGVPKQKIVVGLSADSQNGDKEYTMELEVVIRSNLNMDVYTAVLEKVGNPGDTLLYEIGVHNTGNDEITVTPETVSLPENWTIVFTPSFAKISAENKQVFEIRIGIASRSLTGTNAVKLNFTSQGGLWETMGLEIFVNPIIDFALTKTFAPVDTLYRGDSREMTFHLQSASNAQRNVVISLGSNPSSLSGYFNGVYTGIEGDNISKDFAAFLNLEGVTGIIKPLPDQKMTDIQLTLAPYQEIWVWVNIEFDGIPLEGENSALVLINGTMVNVSKGEAVQFQIMGTKVDIISIILDDKTVDDEAKVKLTEDSEQTLSVVIKNKLTVKATGLKMHLSVDGEKDVVLKSIDEIAPGAESTVVLSWKTKSLGTGEEQMLEFTVTDQGGNIVEAGHISVQLTAVEEETRLSTGYVILAIIFIIAIGVFIIFVIKSVKKGKEDAEDKPEKRKSRREREEDDFFISDRKSYYTDKDYESMGTGSRSSPGKAGRKERLMKRSKTLARKKKESKGGDGD